MTRGNRRFLAGVGVSIAVHVLLMFAYRNAGRDTPVPQPEPPSSIAIRIVPPAPPPEPPRVQEKPQPRAEAATPRSARRSTPKPVIAVPATPQQQDQDQDRVPELSVEQQPEEPAPEGDVPKFDVNAAKQTARQLAGQTKLGREGTLSARMPDPPLETESKAAKAISKAKRRNCKDGLPGGLLAPLFLMMDKKDSGCKW